MSFQSALRRLRGFVEDIRSEDGQALVEYALLVSLVVIVCVVAVQAVGLSASHLYSKINAVYP
jgi:Flp pilus assembly pilin Flp